VLPLALLLFVSAEAAAYECPQNPSPAKTEAYQGFLGRVHEQNGQQLPYRLFVPKDYDETKPYPLVLFLHHAGLAGTDSHNESGWDNCVQLTSEIGSGGYGGVFTHSAVDKEGKRFDTQERYPHFVLAPHANSPAYGFGGGVAGSATAAEHPTRPLLMGVLEQVRKEFNIDPARLYVTGISMGCYGTWDLIMRKPGIFAAASPQSCRGDPNKELLAPLKDMPIWSMCGTNDSYFSGAQAMADGMKAIGATDATFTFTAMQGVGHSIGNRGYDYPGFIDWMFEQRLTGVEPPGGGGGGNAGVAGVAGVSGMAGAAGNGGAPSGQAGQAMGGAAVAGGGASPGAAGGSGGNVSGQGGAATPPGVAPGANDVATTDSSCSLGRSSRSRAPFALILALSLGAAAWRRRGTERSRRAE
jgi:dienelactone hydrolase